MSRGGTRKARSQQAAERKARERKERLARQAKVKQDKPKREKSGKGRAALIHVTTVFAPLVLSWTLLGAGLTSDAVPGSGYFLEGIVDDPNASYFAEPAGLIYMVIAFVIGGLLLLVFPIWLWRRLNRSVPAPNRDRTAVDTGVTLTGVATFVWLIRAVVGFSDAISQLAAALVLIAIYVPFFGAMTALLAPVVPGSGRIGGALPTVLRYPFTRRFLFSEDERRAADAAEAEVKEMIAAQREARKAARARSKNAGKSDDPK